MHSEPRFLWGVIAILGLLLATAVARLLILRRRRLQQDNDWKAVSTIFTQLPEQMEICEQLAEELGQSAAYEQARKLLQEVRRLLSEGNKEKMIHPAKAFKELLLGWNREMEQSLTPRVNPRPMDSGVSLTRKRSNGRSSGSVRRRAPLPELVLQPGPLRGTCSLGMLLPGPDITMMTFFVLSRECSMQYRGNAPMRLGNAEEISKPGVQHPMSPGTNRIAVGRYTLAAEWKPGSQELRLTQSRRKKRRRDVEP
jgi:hypothetical protein